MAAYRSCHCRLLQGCLCSALSELRCRHRNCSRDAPAGRAAHAPWPPSGCRLWASGQAASWAAVCRCQGCMRDSKQLTLGRDMDGLRARQLPAHTCHQGMGSSMPSSAAFHAMRSRSVVQELEYSSWRIKSSPEQVRCSVRGGLDWRPPFCERWRRLERGRHACCFRR